MRKFRLITYIEILPETLFAKVKLLICSCIGRSVFMSTFSISNCDGNHGNGKLNIEWNISC